jgi:hypothetical protein
MLSRWFQICFVSCLWDDEHQRQAQKGPPLKHVSAEKKATVPQKQTLKAKKHSATSTYNIKESYNII